MRLLLDTHAVLWAIAAPDRLDAQIRGALPPLHRDPFDRMLVAQAQVEQAVLVTRDQAIGHYDVQTLPA